MLDEDGIREIKEHLENAQNPVFFYDNDADGLCSYIILRRYLGRGRGVAIRTHPDIDLGYMRKVQELKADYIFVLDKPSLGEKFVREMDNMGIPIVWIDHHDIDENHKGVFSYNSSKQGSKEGEPVTRICYEVTKRKEDMWIAMIGCIADNHLPDFHEEFAKRHRDFWGAKKEIKRPFDAYYKTGIGLLARALSFGLKDSITNVVALQNFLVSCKSPDELMSDMDSYSSFGKKYREIKKKYDFLIKKSRQKNDEKLLFFSYSGDLSISSEISNELYYHNPDKIIVVAYDNGGVVNISLRGKNVRDLIEKVLPEFEGATGGGHLDAVGVRVKSKDLERFKEALKEKIG